MTPLAAVGDGRYTLDEHIATGGMGTVWRATDTRLDRPVAVKILKPEYADDETFRARFHAEARNTAALHHPAVAQLFDFGEVAGTGSEHATAYLVMELVPGEPLSAILAREGALPPERAADILAQAAAGMDVAHRHGIVHRDVKPANLLVTPEGAVKVTDFGIARAGDAVPLTNTGQVIGTPQYLPPEQARGLPATPASDIYALGVVLYECLAGRRPFTGDAPVAVAMQHLRDPVPPLPDSVPGPLAAVCMRALAKEPADRPASAAELAADLRDPGSAPPGPVGVAAGAAAGADAGDAAGPPGGGTAMLTTPGAGPPPAAQRRRRRWLVPALAAAAVLVLLGAVAYALTGSEPGDTAAPGDDSAGPSPAASAEGPARVRVDPAEYRGQPYPAARADLHARGFEVDRAARVGDDGRPGTVDFVQPHGMVPPGTTVTLGVWTPPEDDSGGGGAGAGGDDQGRSEDKGKSDDKGKSGDKGKSDDEGKSGDKGGSGDKGNPDDKGGSGDDGGPGDLPDVPGNADESGDDGKD